MSPRKPKPQQQCRRPDQPCEYHCPRCHAVEPAANPLTWGKQYCTNCRFETGDKVEMACKTTP